MSILSITFHTTENQISNWELYIEIEFLKLIENLANIEKYILSEVDSEMISEGKNTNLLVFFGDTNLRNRFIENEMPDLERRIAKHFGSDVMIFTAFLNPKKQRF